MTANDWCEALGITPPKLEAVVGHREANTFALLLVALLERGEPMTLVDVAARFEEAGIAERSRALLSRLRWGFLDERIERADEGPAKRNAQADSPGQRRTQSRAHASKCSDRSAFGDHMKRSLLLVDSGEAIAYCWAAT